jgi:cytoskeletal protein CcmA (bactofilin family)
VGHLALPTAGPACTIGETDLGAQAFTRRSGMGLDAAWYDVRTFRLPVYGHPAVAVEKLGAHGARNCLRPLRQVPRAPSQGSTLFDQSPAASPLQSGVAVTRYRTGCVRVSEGGGAMVFRRDSKAGDAFQRQISALRQQLGGEGSADDQAAAEGLGATPDESAYGSYRGDGDPGSDAEVGVPDSDAAGAGYGGMDAGTGVTGAVVPEAPPVPELPEVDAQTTVIANGTAWKGEIGSDGTVHVYGRFEGSVRATRDVFLADGADVDATIEADRVVVAGLLKGTVRCGGRFEVLPTGRVSGDVQSPTLVVHEGAIVTGQLRMGPGETASSEAKSPSVVHRRPARGTA